jgi:hypothetical protein
MRNPIAVKVRLAFRFVREISTTFNHHGARRRRSGSKLALSSSRHRQTFRNHASTHLRALLFQNRLARQPDAVAFHRQHLHQNLIAFLQLIANIANAMLRHFADVQ